jgi:hypothetical protein
VIGSIDDPRVLARIGAACGDAAHGVRHRLTTAAHKEAEGQSGTREEGATEDVANALDAIDALGDLLTERLNGELTAADGKKVRIEFRTEKAPQGEENAFGLDLGVGVIIETPGYSAHKAILVQCKRMYGLGAGGTFHKMREDGEAQARDMLSITPASFFFLFNSGDAGDLFKMMRPQPYPMYPWFTEHRPWEPEYFDPGVTVLSAARVLAMADGAKASGRAFPVGAAEVLAASVPLGEFIVGLFAPCHVGDVRLPVLQLATPPTRRKETTGGLDVPVPPLGTLEPRRFFEFRFTKEGEVREKERPKKTRGKK